MRQEGGGGALFALTADRSDRRVRLALVAPCVKFLHTLRSFFTPVETACTLAHHTLILKRHLSEHAHRLESDATPISYGPHLRPPMA